VKTKKILKKYVSHLGLIYDPEEDYSFVLGSNAGVIAKAASEWGKKR